MQAWIDLIALVALPVGFCIGQVYGFAVQDGNTNPISQKLPLIRLCGVAGLSLATLFAIAICGTNLSVLGLVGGLTLTVVVWNMDIA